MEENNNLNNVVPQAAPASTPESQATAPQTDQSPTAQPAEPEWDLAVDENNELVIRDGLDDLFADPDISGQPEPADEGQPQETEATEKPPAEPENQEPEHPSEHPTMVKVKINGIEQEVSLEEAALGYMRGADYTRKTQELANMRKQLENNPLAYQQQQQQNMAPQQPDPQVLRQKQQALLNQADNYAKKRVSEFYGEDYDQYNPQHMAAYVNAFTDFKAAAIQEQIKQHEEAEHKAAVQNNIMQVYNKYREDPNFEYIDRMANEGLQNLPKKYADQIIQAFQTGNSEILDKYMGAVQDEYYGRNKTVAPPAQQPVQAPVQTQPVAQPRPAVRPPFVEPSATNNGAPQPTPNFNFKQLGNMTQDQQLAFLSKYGIG